jgi:MGT family glycosyltransferase
MILFVSYALRGHAMPMIVLAEELARRGHRVIFAMPEEGREWIREPSVDFLPWQPRLPNGRNLTELQRQAREEASKHACQARGQWYVAKSMADTYVPVYESLKPIVERLRPDAIGAGQIVIPAMDLAIGAGIPLIVQSFFVQPNMTRRVRRRSPIATGRLRWSDRVLGFVWQRRLRRVRRLHEKNRRACSPCLPMRDLFQKCTTINFSARCIEQPQATDEKQTTDGIHFVGPLTRPVDPLVHELERWLDQHTDQGVVLAAFGTFVVLRKEQIEALATGLEGCGKQALWVLPERRQSLLPQRPLPFRIEAHIDQNAVLAHPAVKAFVTHAGANSFMESLFWGKPMLAMPFMLDQPAYARKGVELGVATIADAHNMTADAIRRGLSQVLNDSRFAIAASRIGEALRRTPGAAGAADVVERTCGLPPRSGVRQSV